MDTEGECEMKTMRYEQKDIEIVANLLKEGKVVAFPTDTVFGLACIHENEEALQALKASKGRPDHKPIPTMVADVRQMQEIAEMDETAIKLANAFMPGAFTMILKKKATLPDYVSNGLTTIGIRMPDDDFILHLIDLCEKPLFVTSANLSGEATGLHDSDVLEQLDGRIDAIVMGEAIGKTASTIVDVSQGEVQIVREGPVSKQMIHEIVDTI